MNDRLFHRTHGIIPACDVETLDKLSAIISETCGVDGIVGYKVGCTLALSYRLRRIMESIREFTSLPIIYDHQKASTDIPQLGDKFAKTCQKGGMNGVILFPQSGPETEMAFISSIFNNGLVPLVGGEMTHPKYLALDGGFIKDSAPAKMYELAAEMGVEYYILPGNKPEIIRKYHRIISKVIKEPKYCMPGIGAQGGDIKSAFEAAEGKPTYAIIGSRIYKEKNMRKAAEKLCEIVLSFG